MTSHLEDSWESSVVTHVQNTQKTTPCSQMQTAPVASGNFFSFTVEEGPALPAPSLAGLCLIWFCFREQSSL